MAHPVNLTLRTNFSKNKFDYGAIPDKCERPTKKMPDGSEVDLPPILAVCSNYTGCGRWRRINPSCGKRNCVRCQAKRAKKLERRYLNGILSTRNQKGAMWTFVNLTGIHVHLEKETLGPTLRRFGNTMEKFLSEEYDKAGLAVIEHTTRYRVAPLVEIESSGDFYGMHFDGPCVLVHYELLLYVHGHAICYGGFKYKARFEERWGKALVDAGLLSESEFIGEKENAVVKHDGAGYEHVEGLRYVGLEAVRSPKASVGYILKYVAKGIELPEEYLEALKRLKYVRSWGFLYGMQEPTFDYFCSDCGAKVYFIVGGEELVDFLGDRGPLRLEIVPKL